MNMASKATQAFFDSEGIKYELLNEDTGLIRLGFTMENKDSLSIFLDFSADGTSVSLVSFEIAKAPVEKKYKMFELCNSLNKRYKWVRFYYDEEKAMITAQDDAVIQLDSCGEEIIRCCIQMKHIVDEAYPEIMRAIFA